MMTRTRPSRRSTLLVVAAAACAIATVAADYDPIAGYQPVTDVVEHSELDLDMKLLEESADEKDDAGFATAWTAYAVGGNSVKSTGEIRTIQGFSTSAQGKLTGEPWFDIYSAYWNRPDYADHFTSSACNGTDTFAAASVEYRAEACVKGAQYQNVWMYVIHEMEDAINDCEIDNLNANDGGPHAWDEAWAFYAGSVEGEEGTGDGYMLYALAEKRCENFGTCTGDDDGDSETGTSQVNYDALELFDEGQVKLIDGDCDGASDVKDKIVDLMTVPLVQGLLRYFYLADPEGGNQGDKAAGELWSFAAAVLPRIDECDADVASTVYANSIIGSPDAPMAEGYVHLKEQLESVYSCLGISCSQVGGLLIGDGVYYEGFEPCSDGDGALLQDIEIGIVVICIAAVVGCGIGCCIRKRRKQKKSLEAMTSDLDSFGANKAASTL